jgi:mRNA interferase MazF
MKPTKTSNLIPKLWDVVKAPFPYTNRPIEQYRPAIVVGFYKTIDTPILLWVLMVTSAAHRRWQGDVDISDLHLAGLSSHSIIRTSKIATIESTNAHRIGRLTQTDCAEVLENVCKILCIDPRRIEV